VRPVGRTLFGGPPIPPARAPRLAAPLEMMPSASPDEAAHARRSASAPRNHGDLLGRDCAPLAMPCRLLVQRTLRRVMLWRHGGQFAIAVRSGDGIMIDAATMAPGQLDAEHR
jgi:hypothetical protein